MFVTMVMATVDLVGHRSRQFEDGSPLDRLFLVWSLLASVSPIGPTFLLLKWLLLEPLDLSHC